MARPLYQEEGEEGEVPLQVEGEEEGEGLHPVEEGEGLHPVEEGEGEELRLVKGEEGVLPPEEEVEEEEEGDHQETQLFVELSLHFVS